MSNTFSKTILVDLPGERVLGQKAPFFHALLLVKAREVTPGRFIPLRLLVPSRRIPSVGWIPFPAIPPV